MGTSSVRIVARPLRSAWQRAVSSSGHGSPRAIGVAGCAAHAVGLASDGEFGNGSKCCGVLSTQTSRAEWLAAYDVAADEVVQAYLKPAPGGVRGTLPASAPVEIKRLFAFERVHLDVGESKTLRFTVDPKKDLAMADEDGNRAVHHGAAFDVVFTRGHGAELKAHLVVATASGKPEVVARLHKWW